MIPHLNASHWDNQVERNSISYKINVYLNLTLERPLTLAYKGTLYTLAHDCRTQVAKLVTFVTF